MTGITSATGLHQPRKQMTDFTTYTDGLEYVDYGEHAPDRFETIDGFQSEQNTNGSRALEAQKALAHWIPEWDIHRYQDLITHILHLAHREGYDPFDIYTCAINNFHAEAAPLNPDADDK